MRVLGFVLLGALVGLMASLRGAEPPAEKVVNLKEYSAFDAGVQEFLRGEMGPCVAQAFKEVKTYPRFRSSKPLYGKVIFAGDYVDPTKGVTCYYALDESKGSGQGYDRLYFDANRDLDLSNDPPLKAQKPPAGALLPGTYYKQQICFDFVKVEFDCGAEGLRPLELLPRLLEYEGGSHTMTFVATKVVQGVVDVGNRTYIAVVGQDYYIGGRYDHPATALRLKSIGHPDPILGDFGTDRLNAFQQTGGKFYQFNVNPNGTRLTVRRYEGEMGTFAVGPAQRKVSKVEVNGTLSAAGTAVAIGSSLDDQGTASRQQFELPVGDYLPSFLTITLGHLQISISDNYHSEGKPQDRAGRPRVFGIKIQKDRPFTLDFANQPAVMFASPAKSARIKAGTAVEVKAVLIDPQLDIMIRGITDPSKLVEVETKEPSGAISKYQRNRSLDPKILITRANGETVAEGVMPFG
jgi:hypothetical protein